MNDQGGNRAAPMQDHVNKMTQAVQNKKVLLRGETPQSDSADGDSAVAVVRSPKEIFFIYNARDEREPYHFIKNDALWQAGIVSKWQIEELGLVHKERDNEIMLHG